MRRLATLFLLILAVGAARPVPGAVAPGAGAKTTTTSIHVLGTFNGWNSALWDSDPGMTPDGTTWRDTVAIESWAVEQGYQQLKFVTDRAWDSPPDYCLCPARLTEYHALSGPVCAIASGLNVQMYADVPGLYAFTLDETALTYGAELVEPFTGSLTGTVAYSGGATGPVATVWVNRPGNSYASARAFGDASTGHFEAPKLDAGTYSLFVTAPGYPSQTVDNVVVPPGGSIDVGTITLAGCAPASTVLQVLGDFNSWDANTPGMSFANCEWSDTIHVAAGCYYMKFRTNNDWGNDYGTCSVQDPSCLTPLSGHVCLVSGDLALGKINFPATDDYIFHLDEVNGTYQIVSMTTPVRTSSWGQLKARYR
jgi:hypothetical protein